MSCTKIKYDGFRTIQVREDGELKHFYIKDILESNIGDQTIEVSNGSRSIVLDFDEIITQDKFLEFLERLKTNIFSNQTNTGNDDDHDHILFYTLNTLP